MQLDVHVGTVRLSAGKLDAVLVRCSPTPFAIVYDLHDVKQSHQSGIARGIDDAAEDRLSRAQLNEAEVRPVELKAAFSGLLQPAEDDVVGGIAGSPCVINPSLERDADYRAIVIEKSPFTGGLLGDSRKHRAG